MRPKPAESRSARANRNATTKEFDKKGGAGGGGSDSCQPKKQDLSVLRRPVDTSICGLKDAVKLFETGTPEMLHLLSYECDIVYECRVCRNMFRSLANFISHKRVYCRQRYSPSKDLFRSHDMGENYTVLTDVQMDGEELPARITARRDLTSIVESLSGRLTASQFYAEAGEKVAARNEMRQDTTIHLQPIENTSYGVFQTVLNTSSKDLIKNQVTELQSLMAEKEVVLGPDGKIVGNGIDRMPKKDQNSNQKEQQTSSTNKLVCPTCNVTFSTRKTLVQHTRKLHDLTKICYTCPCCKNLFANTWSVYRHLYKVHRKSNEQVRRLRSQIQKKEVKIEKKTTPENTKKSVTEQQRRDEENKAWMEHFEDDSELQRCGGCGRRFERKAALTSHSQICQKRIAAFRIQREPDNHTKLLSSGNLTPVLTPTPCKTEPKKIGIQVRMNYCKTNAHGSSVTQYNEKTDNRCLIDRESDIEVKSIDSKDAGSSNSSFKDYDKTKLRNSLDHLIQNSGSMDKVRVYLNNNSASDIKSKPLTDFKNFQRHQNGQISKIGSLEAKCLQLRNSLQNKVEKCSDDELSSDISEISNKEISIVKGNDLIVQKEEIVVGCENNDNNEEENTDDGIAIIDDKIDLVTDDETHSMKDESDEVVVSSVNKTELMDADSQSDIEKSENTEHEIIVLDTSVEEINEADDSKVDNVSDLVVSNTAVTSTELMDADSQSDIGNTEVLFQNNKSLNINHKTKTFKENRNMQLSVRLMEKKISQYIRPRRMQCLICMKRFQKLRYLRKHIAAHVGWHRYRCLVPLCTFTSFSSSDCIAHLIKVHLGSTDKNRAYSMVGEITPDEWNCNSGTEKSFHLIRSKVLKAKQTLRQNKKNLVSVNSLFRKAETRNSKSLLSHQPVCNGVTESIEKQKRLKIETVADSSTGKEDEKLFTVNVVSDSGSDMSVTTEEEEGEEEEEEEEEEEYEAEEEEVVEEEEEEEAEEEEVVEEEEEEEEDKVMITSKISENMETDKTGSMNDSHVRKMVMEVIFGSSVPPPNISPSVQHSTLPARNRVQFRHNDFFYENDTKINGHHLGTNKRIKKNISGNIDSKTNIESVKK